MLLKRSLITKLFTLRILDKKLLNLPVLSLCFFNNVTCGSEARGVSSELCQSGSSTLTYILHPCHLLGLCYEPSHFHTRHRACLL